MVAKLSTPVSKFKITPCSDFSQSARSQIYLEIQNYNLRKSYIYWFGGNIMIKDLQLSA
jgi:hypothetical protein